MCSHHFSRQNFTFFNQLLWRKGISSSHPLRAAFASAKHRRRAEIDNFLASTDLRERRYDPSLRMENSRPMAALTPFPALRGTRTATPSETPLSERDAMRDWTRDGKSRKRLLHGPMHHWCRSARCAGGPLRLRRSRFARNQKATRGKGARAARPLTRSPSAAPYSLTLVLSKLRLSAPAEAARAFDGIRAWAEARRGLSPALRPLRASGARRRGRISCGGFFTDAPDRRADCARRHSGFPFALRGASFVKPASDKSPPRMKAAREQFRCCVRSAG
jgi:hypothetical protein